ncbi:putative pterin-4-alpha-carbinolamine dehydratase, chloroplastic [Bidens hawaiensis]|uniref:putative pterin-4-alpha-carbinolamine dehydratase, chloroplastic n=1 Tax=Bidens hawaiensis TaxID=980011 RepID=UPI00404B7EC9
MASSFATLSLTPPLTLHNTHNKSFNLTTNRPVGNNNNNPWFKTSRTTRIFASGGIDLLGDFGARDPFPAEIETNFSDNVATFDTEHKILIPNIAALSLAQHQCSPVSPSQPPISENDAKSLLRKVIGWKLVNENGILKLQCLWKLKDAECAAELINRISKAVESTGHPLNIQQDQSYVTAELWTATIGGLSLNDFIVASKIDEINIKDLVPRKRAWA